MEIENGEMLIYWYIHLNNKNYESRTNNNIKIDQPFDTTESHSCSCKAVED